VVLSDRTLGDWLEHWAQQTPDKEYIVYSDRDLRSLRTGIMAGALCPEELMRQVSEKMYMDLTSVYGMTETSPGMTHSRWMTPSMCAAPLWGATMNSPK
jgi:acyl-CoA synthetase (AMP-forming)/AMP-acid ligase II